MRIIEPRHFKAIKPPRKKRHYFRYLSILVVIGGLGYFGYTRFNRPLPPLEYTATDKLSAGPDVKFIWPKYGQSAVGIVGRGLIDSNNSQKAQPIASTAKIITALVVQDKQPIKQGENGPSIAITLADRQIYDKYYLINGAIVPVLPGSSLTQKDLMKGMLIPSANNLAETLTNSVFGSQAEYVKYANQYLKSAGFKKTVVADSSGFSPDTVGAADELVKLSEMAMSDPVIAQIVGQSQALIPNGGIVKSTNWLLGQQGINGIKTGNTNQAGGCFLVSTVITHPDKTKSTVVAAILGAKTVSQAMTDVQPLVLDQAGAGFKDVIVVREDQQLGVVTSAWGQKAALTAKNDLSIFGWQEDTPSYKLKMSSSQTDSGNNNSQGVAVVKLGNKSDTVQVQQAGSIEPPDYWWKFKRIFQN